MQVSRQIWVPQVETLVGVAARVTESCNCQMERSESRFRSRGAQFGLDMTIIFFDPVFPFF